MEIIDFLPSYPSVEKSEYDVLNTHDTNFYDSLYHKKEFYDSRLEKTEDIPKIKGDLMNHQKTISKFLSSKTPYNEILLVHEMGTGKCVIPNTKIHVNNFITTMENIWDKYNSDVIFDGIGYWAIPSDNLYIDSYDTNGEIRSMCIFKLYRQYVREGIQKITLQNGSIIEKTEKHRVLTEYGWKKDLLDAEYVAVSRKRLICCPVRFIVPAMHLFRKLSEALSMSINDEYNYKQPTLQVCLQVINKFKNHKDFRVKNIVDEISKMCSDDIVYMKISSIEEYKYEGWVYDFEIPMYHNYVLNNGIVTHNTCSAIGTIEQIKNEESVYDGAVVFASEKLLNNFIGQLRDKCTSGQYIPEDFQNKDLSKLSSKEKDSLNLKTSKLYRDFYSLKTHMYYEGEGQIKEDKIIKLHKSWNTYDNFANHVKLSINNGRTKDLIQNYSNKILVIDEVHNLRDDKDKIGRYKWFHMFLHLVKNCKIILMSGTPMKSYLLLDKYDFY